MDAMRNRRGDVGLGGIMAIVGVAVLLILIPTAFSILTTTQQTLPGTVNTNELGVSYIVFKTNLNMTAVKNGSSSAIEKLTSNVTEGFNYALDHSRGGTVHAASGVYEIDWPIIMRPNTTLEGNGPDTIIKQADGRNLQSMIVSVFGRNMSCSIHDLTIDGNVAMNPYPDTVRPNKGWGIGGQAYSYGWMKDPRFYNLNVINCWGFGIGLWNGNNSISNCLFKDNYDGIWVTNWTARYNIISNCVFSNNSHTAITSDDYARYNIITGNTINGGANGIFFASGVGNVISNNVISNLTAKGIICSQGISNFQISNNLIFNTNDWGLYIQGDDSLGWASDNIINGNVFRNLGIVSGSAFACVGGDRLYNCTFQGNSIVDDRIPQLMQEGIFIVQSNNCTIISNTINVVSHAVRLGERLGVGCENISVMGNRLIATAYTGDGILEMDSDWNVFEYNDVSQSWWHITHSGIHTIIRYNYGYATENKGVAVILDDGGSITVPHHLVEAPTMVIVTGTTAETASCYVTDIDTNNFTIRIDGTVSTNTDIYWYAEV